MWIENLPGLQYSLANSVILMPVIGNADSTTAIAIAGSASAIQYTFFTHSLLKIFGIPSHKPFP